MPTWKSVLVADDCEQIRVFLIKKLQQDGYHCEAVENGLLALGAYHTNQYDLIVMDGSMPEMNGYEATKQIRKHEQLNQKLPIPIIAFTGDRNAEQKCSSAGMTRYVPKTNIKQLFGIVRLLLR